VRSAPRTLAAACLGLGLLLPGRAPADEGGPGAFEVIVVRGAGVARVTGDAGGAIREETLREDPRPARAKEPAPPTRVERDEAPVVVVVNVPGSAAPVWAVDPFFARHRFRPRDFDRHRGRTPHVFPSDGPGPGVYHGRAREHGHRGGSGTGP